MNYKELENVLGVSFSNKDLLVQALKHSSVSSKVSDNYERLEFLGDRVLGMAVAALLYKIFPNEPEGSLSQRHTALVCKETVAEVAIKLGLDKYISIANEEIRDNANLLCDVCEAIIGFIFLDKGFDAAYLFVEKNWKNAIAKNLTPPKDAKTKLQEVLHVKGLSAPEYKVISRTGSEHEPVFCVAVCVNGLSNKTAEGKNKKIAEQAAASKMLEEIDGN